MSSPLISFVIPSLQKKRQFVIRMLKFKEYTTKLVEADESFDGIITNKLSKDEIKVSKKYILPTNSGSFEIARKDQASFLKLFSEIPNKGAGNGEVGLYWLFNYQRGTNSGRSFREFSYFPHR